MKTYFTLGALGLSLACCLAAVADTEPGAKVNGDIQDIVFFSQTRPVLIRLDIRNAKSSQAAWEEFLRHLLGYLDKDKDGTVSMEEAARTPPAQVLFSESFLFPRLLVPPMALDQPQANRDGKVTVEELRQSYRASGAPFQIQVRPGQARAPVQMVFGPNLNQPRNAVDLNETLFQLLDTNQDGKVCREELAAAPAVLLQRDGDDDEMVTAQEITLGPDPVGFRMVSVPQQAANSAGPDPIFWALAPGESPTNLVRQLLTRYGGEGATPARKLTRQNSGLDEATFNQLDRNGDGALDGEELASFGRRPPDLEVTIDLSKGGQSTSRVVGAPSARLGGEGGQLRLASRSTPLSAKVRATQEGSVVLDLDTTTLELRVSDGTQPRGPRMNITPQMSRERYKGVFATADEDSNGYLDANEARAYPVPMFQALFKLMCLDGDGKLTEKEMLAYLDQMHELRAKAAGSVASLSVVDHGRLFDLLDPDGDGRLSVREERRAVSLLDRLDRNGDGFLGKDEIPHSYFATFVRGPVDTTPFPGGMVANSSPAQPPGSGSTPVRGPLWSRKLDRNQDGDVSRREFAGTDEQFARIDTDGDDLISVEEAERADTLFRAQQDSRP
jgi:Ca2+-binding EF-hand superfamily protein